MYQNGFLETIADPPKPWDAEAAARGHERLLEAVAEARARDGENDAAEIIESSRAKSLLDAIFGNSPFLTWCAAMESSFTCRLLRDGPGASFQETLLNVRANGKDNLNEPALSRAMRVAKRRAALAIAVGDITGAWSLAEVTGALSDFASAALSAAAAFALRTAADEGAFVLNNPDDPETDSGFIVLGMGKLGARELNYSSDIDLVVLFDPEVIETAAPERLQNRMVRVTRTLVKLIDERTADGYVFRTDLRLRPDPGATPIALSVLAAETYYESLGQNWERAAMIKARPVAGDIAAGERFLKWLNPFVWRKNLDFAAIQDIHSIKRQINAQKAGETLTAPGHNIKLGRGGIREIEFFAQTQQLIWGGREPSLRAPVTLEAIPALADKGLCTPETVATMTKAYGFLRAVEHRLQMINDEQTQTLPTEDSGLGHLATFLGYPSAAEFCTRLENEFKNVHDIYSRLFEDSPSLGAEAESGGNLVFTGSDADPETLNTLEGLGFTTPETVDATIRGWHHGRYRAMRSTRAREILTELTPTLLRAIAATPDPDETFLKFDAFLKGLPAGIQLFSMFHAHPKLLDLVAEIMGKAPKLARHLSGRPSVLDGVLTPGFLDPPPPATALEAELRTQFERAEVVEDALDICRRWAHDRRFQVGVQRLQGLIEPAAASAVLSDIAETALKCLYPVIEADFATNHGRIDGGEMAVVAFGKLGSREMTSTSDLDLVFVYDAPGESPQSDGAKPLYATQYFARLGQRFINAITALTSEGSLYEVDMRLRPSGNSGPIATMLPAFRSYQREQAWTWEHMALTRARVVVASPEFGAEVAYAIHEAIMLEREPEKLLSDVADMRNRLAREKKAENLWSLKQLRGGIVDIEFITQYLTLKSAAAHPGLLSPNTADKLAAIRDAGLLSEGDGTRLIEAFDLWQGLQGMLSLTQDDTAGATTPDNMSETLRSDLAAIAETRDFEALEAKVQAAAEAIYDLFCRLIEDPAAALERDE